MTNIYKDNWIGSWEYRKVSITNRFCFCRNDTICSSFDYNIYIKRSS